MPERKHPQLVCDLIRRRREVTRSINEAEAQLERLRADVRAIDHVLGMYRPDMDASAIPPLAYRKPEDGAQRGVMARLVLTLLRTASEPLGAGEITRRIMAARNVEAHLYHDFRKRVPKVIRRLAAQGLIGSAPEGRMLVWSIAAQAARDQ